MSKFAWAIAGIIFLGGCSRGPKERLAGKWVGERIENVSADQIVKATAWVKGFGMSFAADKVTVTVPNADPKSGPYEVARADGSKMVLSVARGDGQRDEAKLSFGEDGKSLHWDIGDAREIVLVRGQ